MPWRDLKYILVSLHKQHHAVDSQTKSRFYETALARKKAGTTISATTAATIQELSNDKTETKTAEAHARFAKWSDERANLWAKTHHTLGATRKNDITRPDKMLEFDSTDSVVSSASFSDSQWTSRKLVDDAMTQILAVERCLRHIQADASLASVHDPQLLEELESHRADLSNTLQLRQSPTQTWQVLVALQLPKGKRMIIRSLAAFDKARLSLFLQRIFRDIAHFLFSQSETDEFTSINEKVADTLVGIIERVEVPDLALLSSCFDALVETQTPQILRYYLQTPVSARVIESLILRGSSLVQNAKDDASTQDNEEVQTAVTLWEGTTQRLTTALQAQ